MLVKEGFNYKAFPIFFLAFFRVANVVIIDLAFPLYYAQINVNPEIIGIILAARAFSYLFSPILLRNIPKKIGKKNCLLISGTGTLIITIGYEISLNPLAGLFLRFVDGLLLGMFWPVLMGSISSVCNLDGMRENDEKKDKIMRRYSISWNFGGIVSYLIGTIMLFLIDDLYLIFHIALFFAILQFISSFLYKEPMEKINLEKPEVSIEYSKPPLLRENVKFPKFFPFFIVMVYSFLLGAIGLIYPLKSEMLQYAIYTNYLFFFIRMTTQTILLSTTMKLSINLIKKLFPYILIATSVSLLIMGLNQNLIIFGILFGINGIVISFFYLFSFKIVIFRDMVENTYRNSTYFEASVGLFFFIGPIIGGLLATIDINLAFYILSVTSIGTLIAYLIIRNKLNSD